MIRSAAIAAFLLFTTFNTSPGLAARRPHDVYRFVGFVTKWDARHDAMDMASRENVDGKQVDVPRHIVLRTDCKVMRYFKEVRRSDLKPGTYVVVDAAGVDITDLEGVQIEIVPPQPTPKKK